MKAKDDEQQAFEELLAEIVEYGNVSDDFHDAVREGEIGDILSWDLGDDWAPVRFVPPEDEGVGQFQLMGGGDGEKGKDKDKKCGPDVSEWFRNEMERHRQNLDKVRANFPPILWIAWVWKNGMSIQYKSMDFKSKNCPSGCDDTVWLCGHCVDRSELGNIILGFWVAYLGFSAAVLVGGVNVIGSKKPGEGADNATDAAGIGLGHAMGVKLRKARGKKATPAELKTAKAFCSFLNEGIPHNRERLREYFKPRFKNWKIWVDGWSNPFTHIVKGHEDCKKCKDVWTGKPHPLPSPRPPLK